MSDLLSDADSRQLVLPVVKTSLIAEREDAAKDARRQARTLAKDVRDLEALAESLEGRADFNRRAAAKLAERVKHYIAEAERFELEAKQLRAP